MLSLFLVLQHAHALELLSDKLTEGASALDVGSGSGYLTACFARMVTYTQILPCYSKNIIFEGLSANPAFSCCLQTGPNGRVVGIEHIDELVQMSIKNVQADDPELLTSGRIKLVGVS